VGAMKKVGNGMVYYIGTNFGASISAGDSGGIDVLRAVVSNVVRPPATSSGNLRPRLIQGAGRGLLAVFNDTSQNQKATIAIPASFHRATDIYNHREYANQESRFDVAVPFREVAVFDLA
jgi:hypothetical protein